MSISIVSEVVNIYPIVQPQNAKTARNLIFALLSPDGSTVYPVDKIHWSSTSLQARGHCATPGWLSLYSWEWDLLNYTIISIDFATASAVGTAQISTPI